MSVLLTTGECIVVSIPQGKSKSDLVSEKLAEIRKLLEGSDITFKDVLIADSAAGKKAEAELRMREAQARIAAQAEDRNKLAAQISDALKSSGLDNDTLKWCGASFISIGTGADGHLAVTVVAVKVAKVRAAKSDTQSTPREGFNDVKGWYEGLPKFQQDYIDARVAEAQLRQKNANSAKQSTRQQYFKNPSKLPQQ